MRVFMTGATGYIGTATVSALINSGHEVTALVRPSTEASALERAGVKIVRGELKELPKFSDVLSAHEVAIHAALDSTSPAENDAAALDALLPLETLKVVYTSGPWVFGDTGDGKVDETSELNPVEIASWRAPHELRVLREAKGGGAVVRPGCVYGGSQDLLAEWFAAAEKGDPLVVIGHGLNCWAMVHQDDLADLYLKVVEGGHEGVLHAIDDTREPMGRIARAIIEGIGSESEIHHKTLEQAREELGPLADALALDQHVSSEKTRSLVGWEPSVSFVHSVERQWEEWKQARS